MRLLSSLGLLLLVACTATPSGSDASNSPCGDGGVLGPNGTCVAQCVNTCLSDSDCPQGSACVREGGGCTQCVQGFVGSGSPPDGGICSTLSNAIAGFNEKAIPCQGDGGFAVFDLGACEASLAACDSNDLTMLDQFAGCLDSLSQCNPDHESVFTNNLNACASDVSNLSPPCESSLNGSADGGSDTSPPDAGFQSDGGCSGGFSQGNSCHSTSDCCGTICMSPGAVECGVCRPPASDTCSSPADCGSGEVCASVPPMPCTCPPQSSQQCIPSCATAGCDAGFTCGNDGLCLPLPCGQGIDCPSNEQCTRTDAGDVHGCTAIPCVADTDCPAKTFCVNGACEESLGTCMAPVP